MLSSAALAIPAVAAAAAVGDRIGIGTGAADYWLISAHAAVRLGETDHAVRLLRHSKAADVFGSPFYGWMREETVSLLAAAGAGPDLTPHALDRNELFAILVDLQQRHPVAGT